MCLTRYVFFFFKQKTAYEMRISDWSSDVCSSDLAQAEQHQPDAEHAVHPKQRSVTMQRGQVEALHVKQRQRRIDQEAEQTGADQKIGRASGRERVCTYV